jgi:hypothetical protein
MKLQALQFYLKNVTTLLEFLQTLPQTSVNLNYYQADQCGTIHCTLGWATTISSFQEMGLTLNGMHWPVMLTSQMKAVAPWVNVEDEGCQFDFVLGAETVARGLFGDTGLYHIEGYDDSADYGAHDFIFAGKDNGQWDDELQADGDLCDHSLAVARLKKAQAQLEDMINNHHENGGLLWAPTEN